MNKLSFLHLFFCVVLVSTLTAGVDVKVDRKPVHEAYVTKVSPLVPIEMVSVKPPQDLIEVPPLSPGSRSRWIQGYWDWNSQTNSYDWVCGVWRVPPPGMHWIQGYYSQDSGWYRIPGSWHPSPSQVVIAETIPPPNLEENIPKPNEKNLFWSPGYWDYNPYEKNYNWLGGSWQPFDQDWILIPAFWTWRQEGYLFHPAYWDYTLEKRGGAYDCEGGNSYWPISQDTLISRLYYSNPDYQSIFAHHYNFQPDYWKNCWCLPPWWDRPEWWTFDALHQWDLWWSWTHPGYSPSWVAPGSITPADRTLIDLFKVEKAPVFMTSKGAPPYLQWIQAIRNVSGRTDPLLLSSQWQAASNIVEANMTSLKQATTKKATSEKPKFEENARAAGVAPVPQKSDPAYIPMNLNPVPTKTSPPVSNYTSPTQNPEKPTAQELRPKEVEKIPSKDNESPKYTKTWLHVSPKAIESDDTQKKIALIEK